MDEQEILRAKLNRRRLLRYGILAGGSWAGLGLLSACAPSNSTSTTASATPRKGGTLIFGQGTGPANLDPHGAGQSTPILGHWRQMYDTLVSTETTALKVTPQLATSWKLIDSTTWEFKLRTGVKFHNGEDFDANAVKFSLDRIVDPKQKATIATRFSALTGVEVVDAQTVRMHTSTPFPVLLLGLSQAMIMPPKYTTQNPEKVLTAPIGSGPFMFDSWQQGSQFTYVANTSYWGGRPNLDKLVFRVIPDDAARLAALKSGEIHIDMNLPLDAIEAVSSDPNLKVASAFIVNSLILEMDTLRGGPTANPKVRMAINYAIDKEQINKTLLSGKLKPLAGQLLTEGTFGFNPNVKMVPYDPNMAKQLLAEAGFASGFDTQINGPIGKYTADREIVIAVADQLNKVGIRAKANPMDYGLFVQKLVANEAGPMFLIGWFSFGDPALATGWLSSRSTLGQYYKDATYDALDAKGASDVDEKTRQATYYELAQHMHDQASAGWLFQAATYYGVSKKVTGFEPRTDELPYFYPAAVGE
jgi:peptide/nickel transport system substrate-binding protein